MRLLVTSDWHADAVTAGILRFREVAESVATMMQAAIQNRCDVFVFAGDLANPGRMHRTIDSMVLAITCARALSDAGIDSVWITGNHDVVDTDELSSTIKPLQAMADKRVHVHDSPIGITVRERRFLLLPYIPKVLAHLYDDSIVTIHRVMEKAEWKKLDDAIVVSHLTAVELEGLTLGSESNELKHGKDYELPLAFFRKEKVPLIVQGHFHKHQQIGNLLIPGAVSRYTFGEQNHQPAYHIVDI